MQTSVAKTWIKFELCVLDPDEREINLVHYFLHPVCVMYLQSCATGPASQRLWLCVAVAELRWFLWHVQCWQDSCGMCDDSVTLAGPVSPRTLNAACLRVKVESITILTERPALNWPCAVFASRSYNAIRCHGRDWHLWQLPCSGPGSGRGRHTHAAQH